MKVPTKRCGHPDTTENTLYSRLASGKVRNKGCRACDKARSKERKRKIMDERLARGEAPRGYIRRPGWKRCCGCLTEKPIDEFSLRTDRQNGKSQGRQARCKKCSNVRRAVDWRDKDKKAILSQRNREAAGRLRWLALAKYSLNPEVPRCACCGTPDHWMLTIEHIYNDGADHRRAMSESGTSVSIYRYLRREGWPPGFEILCLNCNVAKQRLGDCPHRNHEARSIAAAIRNYSANPPGKGKPNRHNADSIAARIQVLRQAAVDARPPDHPTFDDYMMRLRRR